MKGAQLGQFLQDFRTDRRPAKTPRCYKGASLTGRVALDGATFEDCTFEKARLVYAGGVLPSIQGCSFDEVTFEFEGAAGRTLSLLQAFSAPSSGLAQIFKASFSRIFGH